MLATIIDRLAAVEYATYRSSVPLETRQLQAPKPIPRPTDPPPKKIGWAEAARQLTRQRR